MMGHKHKWQFTNFNTKGRIDETILSIRFVCECGRIKDVKLKKQEDEE